MAPGAPLAHDSVLDLAVPIVPAPLLQEALVSASLNTADNHTPNSEMIRVVESSAAPAVVDTSLPPFLDKIDKMNSV